MRITVLWFGFAFVILCRITAWADGASHEARYIVGVSRGNYEAALGVLRDWTANTADPVIAEKNLLDIDTIIRKTRWAGEGRGMMAALRANSALIARDPYLADRAASLHARYALLSGAVSEALRLANTRGLVRRYRCSGPLPFMREDDLRRSSGTEGVTASEWVSIGAGILGDINPAERWSENGRAVYLLDAVFDVPADGEYYIHADTGAATEFWFGDRLIFTGAAAPVGQTGHSTLRLRCIKGDNSLRVKLGARGSVDASLTMRVEAAVKDRTVPQYRLSGKSRIGDYPGDEHSDPAWQNYRDRMDVLGAIALRRLRHDRIYEAGEIADAMALVNPGGFEFLQVRALHALKRGWQIEALRYAGLLRDRGYRLPGSVIEAAVYRSQGLASRAAERFEGYVADWLDPAGILQLSDLQRKAGKYAAARSLLERGIAAFPERMALRLRLFDLVNVVDGPEDALAVCAAMERLNPWNPEMLMRKGLLYYRLGRDELAFHFLRQAQNRGCADPRLVRYLDLLKRSRR